MVGEKGWMDGWLDREKGKGRGREGWSMDGEERGWKGRVEIG